MIQLYSWNTPNGRKASIMLEECELPYQVTAIDITQGQQREAQFLEVSPNGRIPAIVDTETGTTLMESGAILLYLADKTGRFTPSDPQQYWEMMQWLMWQMGGVGPMFGQVHHFVKYNPGVSEYAEQRYLTETRRLYQVLDQRLADREFVTEEYSIADIAIWPWVSRFEWQTIDLNDYPHVKRWYCQIAQRPAVQRGYHIPHEVNPLPIPEDS